MTSITKITLHHYPLSRSARVKWLLHEVLGDDFETKRVALLQGQQFSPDFIAKNPNHGVPVLDVVYEDGSEQTIYESIAILIFLADTYSEKGFAPSPQRFAGACRLSSDDGFWWIMDGYDALANSPKSRPIAEGCTLAGAC